MRRWLFTLALSVLLCGCVSVNPVEAVPTTDTALPTQTTSFIQPEETTIPPETEPAGWDEGSVEDQTNGALLSWQLPGRRIAGIRFMGQDLLALYNDEGYTQLRLFSLEDMSIKASTELMDYVTNSPQSWAATEDRFAYYSVSENAVIFLDTQLTPVCSIPVPEDIREQIVITGDLKTAYYSKGGVIYSLDLESGESVLRFDVGINTAYLYMNLMFEDTVLSYRDPGGKAVFLSTQTWQIIGSDDSFDGIASGGERYFLARVADDYQEYLVGTFGAEQAAFTPKKNRYPEYQGYLPDRHAVVFKGNEDGKTFFDCYDLTTGKRTAAMLVDFGDAARFSRLLEDPTGDYLWFMTTDANDENSKLYRWEYGAMPVEDDRVYTGKRYTESNPDMEGIARCRARADEMEETYGVEILLHNEAKVPYGYGVKYLYQVRIIEQSLDSLETALASYPEGFFKTLGTVSQNGKIQISLARRIVVDSDWIYYDCMPYWDNGNACIVVQSGYLTGRLVNRGVGYILEAFLRNGGGLENWESCNPTGFTYYGSYEAAVGGDYRSSYFIDQKAMISRGADVAVVFEYAMMDYTEKDLKRYSIQKKLALLCESIREAFDLTETTQMLPWEKYLLTTE